MGAIPGAPSPTRGFSPIIALGQYEAKGRWDVMNGLIRRRRGHERGASLVEAAFVIPLLLLLVLGVVEYGFMVNRDTVINNAAREGAREAIFGSSESDIEQRVRDAASNLDQAELTVTVTCKASDGSACPGSSYDAEWEPGGSAIITVDYVYHFITPLTNLVGLGSTQDLTAQVEMRIEG